MTIEFNSEEDQPQEAAKGERIAKILQQFSRLSPEKQEAVLKFIDYLEKKRERK